MLTAINLNTRNHKRSFQRRRALSLPMSFGVNAAGFATVIIVCFLAIFYLMQANQTATFGYEIEAFDRKKTELKEERERLDLEIARLRSTNKIKEKLNDLKMEEVDPGDISYYEINSGLASSNVYSSIGR